MGVKSPPRTWKTPLKAPDRFIAHKSDISSTTHTKLASLDLFEQTSHTLSRVTLPQISQYFILLFIFSSEDIS